MSWKRTTITVTMGNQKYPKGYKIFNFNNVVENPTQEQIEQFAQGLVLLSEGDVYMGATVIRHDELEA